MSSRVTGRGWILILGMALCLVSDAGSAGLAAEANSVRVRVNNLGGLCWRAGG